MNNIYTERPEELNLLTSYTNKIGIDNDTEKLSEKLGKELFALIIKDYKSGLLSVDNLSALCELMYGRFDAHSDIYTLLSNGAEIEWYIRNEPVVAADFISDLLKYFE